MALSWSARRQLLYYAVGLVVFGAITWGLYEVFLTSTPTCFDGTQNQNERGVDCGGVCSLVCQSDARPLVVLWSRVFEIAPGTYTAAAYVKNDNVTAGAKGVNYSFQLFDADNVLVIERDGTIDLPPAPLIPIVETNINAGTRSVLRVLFSFVGAPVWRTTAAAPLRVANQILAGDGSKLSASVQNDTLSAARAAVVAVLFDQDGVARAASKSSIEVPKKGQAPVVFTWPAGVPDIVRAEITALPSF